MLTKEILKANATLVGLTDDQITAIEQLSKNDENNVIAKKMGETHGMYQNDIESVLGVKKPEGWKSSKGTSHTYEWLKESVLPDLQKQAKKDDSELQIKITELETSNADLKKQIADGSGDAALKSQLADQESTITKLRADLKKTNDDWEAKLATQSKSNFDSKLNGVHGLALVNLKFKSSIPQMAIDAAIVAAKNKVLQTGKAEILAGENGGENVVFRDDKNLLVTNPENLQKPITYSELLLKELSPILETGKKAAGAGSGKGDTDTPTILNLEGVTNRVDADRAARTYLAAQGYAAGSPKFQEELNKIYTDNKLSELPAKAD